MTELTDQELNEGVAKALGLRHEVSPYGVVWLDHSEQSGPEFSPATDPAAAVWALERYCKDQRVAGVVRCLGMLDQWTCCIGEEPENIPLYKTAERAICLAILEAAPQTEP